MRWGRGLGLRFGRRWRRSRLLHYWWLVLFLWYFEVGNVVTFLCKEPNYLANWDVFCAVWCLFCGISKCTIRNRCRKIRTTILPSIPSSCASTSMVALSVSCIQLNTKFVRHILSPHNLEQNISCRECLPFLFFPRSDATFSHGRGHGWHLEVGYRVSGRGLVQACHSIR